jgi:hypothetical protein
MFPPAMLCHLTSVTAITTREADALEGSSHFWERPTWSFGPELRDSHSDDSFAAEWSGLHGWDYAHSDFPPSIGILGVRFDTAALSRSTAIFLMSGYHLSGTTTPI